MKQEKLIPEIVNASQSESVFMAALSYMKLGFSVLPLNGKRPACREWRQYQRKAADYQTIRTWDQSNLLKNVGIVCGKVSGNLVVLDLDGVAGYPAFAAQFPKPAETYTVATGGGVGKHIYWRVDKLPESVKAMQTPIGNLELCAEGRQIVGVPSIHPDTQKPYRVEIARAILHVPNLDEIVRWIESFKTNAASHVWKPPRISPTNGNLNPRLIDEIARYFASQGYKSYGDWLHGQCIYPERHTNGDAKPSFGFSVRSGFGHCYRCGTILAKDICETAGIDPKTYGGLVEKAVLTIDQSPTKTADRHGHEKSPGEQADPDSIVADNTAPPIIPNSSFDFGDLNVPNLLKIYTEWAGATANETPLSFHFFAGMWLVATAINRRLYAEAPWGQSIYPNLYMMIVAVSTYYRKSTAFNLAHRVADEVFDFLLMNDPGSPEALISDLSGQLPTNLESFSQEQQAELKKAAQYAAQRALQIDEISELFGKINRRDYMVGMKEYLMKIYDCPPKLSRNTRQGLCMVKRPCLSIFGATTPAALAGAIREADWYNGLFSRFILLPPESNYQERPALRQALPIPAELLDGLSKLFHRLPAPPDQSAEDASQKPERKVKVECWDACLAYSSRLRQYCNPDLSTGLEDQLRPLYGRLHIQAFKFALILAALRWLDTSDPVPTVTLEDWRTAEKLAEYLRANAHCLLEQLGRDERASRERTLQDKVLAAFAESGTTGRKLRDVYRKFEGSNAAEIRAVADELVRAGELVPIKIGRAEGYMTTKFFEEVSGKS